MMMAKMERTSHLSFSRGDVTVKVGVEGKIDQGDRILDHMTMAATTALSIESVQPGLVEQLHQHEDGTRETCAATIEVGEIKVMTEITVNSKLQIPKRMINTVLFGVVLPKVLQSVALHIGDYQWQTTTQTRGGRRSHGEILSELDGALGLPQATRWPTDGQIREFLAAQQHQRA
jgi:hypothetical protein